jgi:hypothetical protein
MASLGTGTTGSLPSVKAASTDLTPGAGVPIDTAVKQSLFGSGTSVTPKRYLNVAGVWTPIQ